MMFVVGICVHDDLASFIGKPDVEAVSCRIAYPQPVLVLFQFDFRVLRQVLSNGRDCFLEERYVACRHCISFCQMLGAVRNASGTNRLGLPSYAVALRAVHAMPHIHLTTSADLVENVDVPEILAKLVAVLAAQESIEPKAIKAYHTLRSTWAMGEGAPHGFAHCEVAIVAGRSPELRRSIAEAMFAALTGCFAGSVESGEAGVTLELREMAKETYMK